MSDQEIYLRDLNQIPELKKVAGATKALRDAARQGILEEKEKQIQRIVKIYADNLWKDLVRNPATFGGLYTWNQLVLVITNANITDPSKNNEWQNLFAILKPLTKKLGSKEIEVLFSSKAVTLAFVQQLLQAIPEWEAKIPPYILFKLAQQSSENYHAILKDPKLAKILERYPDARLRLYYENQDSLFLAESALSLQAYDQIYARYSSTSVNDDSLPKNWSNLKSQLDPLMRQKRDLEQTKANLEEKELYLLQYKQTVEQSANVERKYLNLVKDPAADIGKILRNTDANAKRLRAEGDHLITLLKNYLQKIQALDGEEIEEDPQLKNASDIENTLKQNQRAIKAKQVAIDRILVGLRRIFAQHNFSVEQRALDIFLGDLYQAATTPPQPSAAPVLAIDSPLAAETAAVPAKEVDPIQGAKRLAGKKLLTNKTDLLAIGKYASLIDQEHLEVLLAAIQLHEDVEEQKQEFRKLWAYLVKHERTRAQLINYINEKFNVAAEAGAQPSTNRQQQAFLTLVTFAMDPQLVPVTDLKAHVKLTRALFGTRPVAFAEYVVGSDLQEKPLSQFLGRQCKSLSGEHLVELAVRLEPNRLDWQKYLNSRPRDQRGRLPGEKLKTWLVEGLRGDDNCYNQRSGNIFTLLNRHSTMASSLNLASERRLMSRWLGRSGYDAKVSRLISQNDELFKNFNEAIVPDRNDWRTNQGGRYLDARERFDKSVLAAEWYFRFLPRAYIIKKYLQELQQNGTTLEPAFAYVLATVYWSDIKPKVSNGPQADQLRRISPFFEAKLSQDANDSNLDKMADFALKPAQRPTMVPMLVPNNIFLRYHLTTEENPEKLFELALTYPALDQAGEDFAIANRLRRFLTDTDEASHPFFTFLGNAAGSADANRNALVVNLVTNTLAAAAAMACKKDLPESLLTIILSSPVCRARVIDEANPHVLDRIALLIELNRKRSTTASVVVRDVLTKGNVVELVRLLHGVHDNEIAILPEELPGLIDKIIADWANYRGDVNALLSMVLDKATLEQKVRLALQQPALQLQIKTNIQTYIKNPTVGILGESSLEQLMLGRLLEVLSRISSDSEAFIMKVLEDVSLISLFFKQTVAQLNVTPVTVRAQLTAYVMNNAGAFNSDVFGKILLMDDVNLPEVVAKLKENKSANSEVVRADRFNDFAAKEANKDHVISLMLNVGDVFSETELNDYLNSPIAAIKAGAVAICAASSAQLTVVLNSANFSLGLLDTLASSITTHFSKPDSANALTSRAAIRLANKGIFEPVFANNLSFALRCFNEASYVPSRTAAEQVVTLAKADVAKFETTLSDTQLQNSMSAPELEAFVLTRPALCHRLMNLVYPFTADHKAAVIKQIITGSAGYLNHLNFNVLLTAYVALLEVSDKDSPNFTTIAKLWLKPETRGLLKNVSVSVLQSLLESGDPAIIDVIFTPDFAASELFAKTKEALAKINLTTANTRYLFKQILRDPSVYLPGIVVNGGEIMAELKRESSDEHFDPELNALVLNNLAGLKLVFTSDEAQSAALATTLLMNADQRAMRVVIENAAQFQFSHVIANPKLVRRLIANPHFLRAVLQTTEMRAQIGFTGEELVERSHYEGSYVRAILDNPSDDFKEFIRLTLQRSQYNPHLGPLSDALHSARLSALLPPAPAVPTIPRLTSNKKLPQTVDEHIRSNPKKTDLKAFIKAAKGNEECELYELALEYYLLIFQHPDVEEEKEIKKVDVALKVLKLAFQEQIFAPLLIVLNTEPPMVSTGFAFLASDEPDFDYIQKTAEFIRVSIPRLHPSFLLEGALFQTLNHKYPNEVKAYVKEFLFSDKLGSSENMLLLADETVWENIKAIFLPEMIQAAFIPLLNMNRNEQMLDLLLQPHIWHRFRTAVRELPDLQQPMKEWVLALMKEDERFAAKICHSSHILHLLNENDIEAFIGNDKNRARQCFHYPSLYLKRSLESLKKTAFIAGYGDTPDEAFAALRRAPFAQVTIDRTSLLFSRPTPSEQLPATAVPERPAANLEVASASSPSFLDRVRQPWLGSPPAQNTPAAELSASLTVSAQVVTRKHRKKKQTGDQTSAAQLPNQGLLAKRIKDLEDPESPKVASLSKDMEQLKLDIITITNMIDSEYSGRVQPLLNQLQQISDETEYESKLLSLASIISNHLPDGIEGVRQAEQIMELIKQAVPKKDLSLVY